MRLRALFYGVVMGMACAASLCAQLPTDAVPSAGDSDDELPMIELDTKPLPKLKTQEEVAHMPSGALTDAFGLPMFVPVEGEDKQLLSAEMDVKGGEIGRVVNRLSIQGVLAGHEAIIDTFVVPMGGTFAVKVKENETVLLHIQEISDKAIVFGWSKDDTTYRYVLPKKKESDTYLEDTLKTRDKKKKKP